MAFLHLLPRIPKPRKPSSLSLTARFSFSSPEQSATARRRRRRLLGLPPPLPPAQIPPPFPPNHPPLHKPQPCPSIPKLPSPISSLSSSPLLLLHNTILSLLLSGDLHEALLLVRHSVYSNSRPTIYTINAVLYALLAKSLYSDVVSLYRFANQAGIAASIFTHEVVLRSYVGSSKLDLAMDHYRFLSRELPILASKSIYRVLVSALVRGARLEEAVELKDEMVAVMEVDVVVYDVLICGFVDVGDSESAVRLYEELEGKISEGFGGVVCGSVMKAYFMKGMEKEALELYESAVGKEGLKVGFSVESYNSVLDALCENGKFGEALSLFERMMDEHCPPRRISVSLESFALMVDGYCAAGRFGEAVDVFRRISEKKISADTLLCNNLIGKLGKNGMVAEAEEIYREMSLHEIKPNELTFALLMEACFVVQRMEDAIRYLSEMADSGVEPGTLAYNAVLCGLVKVGNFTEAKVFFDRMMEKEVKRDVVSYEVLLKAFCESNRLDDVFMVVRALLMDKNVVFQPQMKELVEDFARREKMEGELVRLYDEVEKEKEDVLARIAEEKARADALSREERLRKREEAKAKQAATTRITKEHIEMHIKRFSLNNAEVKQDVPPMAEIFGNGGTSK